MKRLTQLFEGKWIIDSDTLETVTAIPLYDETGRMHLAFAGTFADRLAAYEDTGLTPEEYSFNKEQLRVMNLFMEQIADAEEAVRRAEACRDDRLVILPCKVGDMVYYRRGSYIIGDDVKRIVLDGIDNQVIIDHNHSFMFSDFGRKVWSSREEAEAALKGEYNAN